MANHGGCQLYWWTNSKEFSSRAFQNSTCCIEIPNNFNAATAAIAAAAAAATGAATIASAAAAAALCCSLLLSAAALSLLLVFKIRFGFNIPLVFKMIVGFGFAFLRTELA